MRELSVHDDALFCEEIENWGEDEEEQDHSEVCDININGGEEEDLSWEEEELQSLFSREKQIHSSSGSGSDSEASRRLAVEWVLKVNAHHGFTTLTAVLAVNYIDRFLNSIESRTSPPWMAQLAAVACLSLAAKVEETQVPLLLDLQVGETEHVFEPKTIQRMELLVLSTLRWRMHPVTPLSFLDHVVRRLGLRTLRRREFLRRCERLILSAASDLRFVGYPPSVVAAAAMIRAVENVDLDDAVDYQNRVLGVLEISKEEVKRCYELISHDDNTNPRPKRKYNDRRTPTSPSGVIDASFDSDCSDDSCSSSVTTSFSSYVCFSTGTDHAPLKRSKTTHQEERRCFGSIDRVSVDFVGSSR